MSRAASVVLLLLGAVLCVTWIVSPASSAPQSSDPPRPSDPRASTTDDVAVEMIHLDAVAEPPRYVAPRRDPFSFQSRPVPARPSAVAPSVVAPPVRESVILPTLVAIVKHTAPTGDVFRAVLSADRFDVTIVSTGQSFAGFVIGDISATVVKLRQASSGESFDLSLR
jgi:hypothetical protein